MKRARGAKFVTSTAEEYRRYVRQCLEIAASFQDKEARATLLGLAQAWSRLAHLALANRQIAELTVQIARQHAWGAHSIPAGSDMRCRSPWFTSFYLRLTRASRIACYEHRSARDHFFTVFYLFLEDFFDFQNWFRKPGTPP
jgi:hypothetical protein